VTYIFWRWYLELWEQTSRGGGCVQLATRRTDIWCLTSIYGRYEHGGVICRGRVVLTWSVSLLWNEWEHVTFGNRIHVSCGAVEQERPKFSYRGVISLKVRLNFLISPLDMSSYTCVARQYVPTLIC
jgi:hypothetical protein